ncbi:MAG TPA: RagB/SusD family nutrient uptake outer membrane protein [Gemmatimonadaceae bacterium]|nr:RagB/SusD family nutrient uptake outer membrane protein [Gemmatimonadaceae bacterium]
MMTPNTHSAPGRRIDGSAGPRRGATGAARPSIRTSGPSWRVRPAAVLALAFVAVTGCDRVDDLLSVETPSRLAENTLLIPANADLLVKSAVGDFQCAYGGYVVASGLGAGELTETSQTASRWSYDRRDVRPTDAHYSTFGCTDIGVYTPISTARYTNDQILQKLEEWTDEEVPGRQELIATAATFAGYSYLLLGEGFCTATVNGGAELTSEQLFDSAEVRFTRAIEVAQTTGDAAILNLAYVGRARARLYGGDPTGAAADAQAVPVGFVYTLESTDVASRYYNRVAAQNITGNVVSVAPAYQNPTVQGVADPRVQAVDAGTKAGDGETELWRQKKYPDITTPMPLATGVEAQLILAEALGGAEGATILNNLRARAGVNLPPLTAAERANLQQTIFDERSRELWLQGTRWYDLRRGNLPLVPATGSPYLKGGTYGDQRCWPLPDVERLANPNIPDQG